MSGDQTIYENAAAAAQQPANNPPAASEERRAAIAADPEFYQIGTARQQALADEMRQLITMATPDVASTPARSTSTTPTPSASEKRLAELNRFDNPDGIYAADPARREAAMREVRQLVAADDQQSYVDASLTAKREMFGLTAPDMPAPWLEHYDANYSGHEDAFLVVAKDAGLTAGQVKDLRAAAIEAGQRVADAGRPLDAAEITAELARLGIPADARPALVDLWDRLVGGAS